VAVNEDNISIQAFLCSYTPRHLLKSHHLAVAGADALSAKKPTAGKRELLQGYFAGASVAFKGAGRGRAVQKGPRGRSTVGKGKGIEKEGEMERATPPFTNFLRTCTKRSQ